MDFLFDGPAGAPAVLLAHGAGAPMDQPAMTAVAAALGGAGLRVARFEFAYMAARRTGQRRPPPRAEALVPEFAAAVGALAAPGPLIVGGKSMGGRVASLAADDLRRAGLAAGLLCVGYPFHPPGNRAKLRTAHLASLSTPTLICQGTRDPFGTREDVAQYALAPAIEVLWLEDGDHDLTPRRTAAQSAADHLATVARAAAAFAARIA